MRSVLFDMDGVLLDSEIPAFDMLRESLAAFGVQISLEELLTYIGNSTRMIAENVLKKYSPEDNTDEFLSFHASRGSFYATSDKVRPMEGLEEFLLYLKHSNIQTAVVSSTRSVSVLNALNRMNILKYFDIVIGGDMLAHTKPDPEGYNRARRLLGSAIEECLVIEDSPTGIKAAKNAGLKVIGYKGSAYQQDTSGADAEFESYEGLKKSRYFRNFAGIHDIQEVRLCSG